MLIFESMRFLLLVVPTLGYYILENFILWINVLGTWHFHSLLLVQSSLLFGTMRLTKEILVKDDFSWLEGISLYTKVQVASETMSIKTLFDSMVFRTVFYESSVGLPRGWPVCLLLNRFFFYWRYLISCSLCIYRYLKTTVRLSFYVFCSIDEWIRPKILLLSNRTFHLYMTFS